MLFLFDPWRYYFPPSLAVYLKDICHISHSISRYFVVNGFYLIIKKSWKLEILMYLFYYVMAILPLLPFFFLGNIHLLLD